MVGKEEEDDEDGEDGEAELRGGEVGGGGLARKASMAVMPCVGGHPRCQRRCSCALTESGLGHETDGVA